MTNYKGLSKTALLKLIFISDLLILLLLWGLEGIIFQLGTNLLLILSAVILMTSFIALIVLQRALPDYLKQTKDENRQA